MTQQSNMVTYVHREHLMPLSSSHRFATVLVSLVLFSLFVWWENVGEKTVDTDEEAFKGVSSTGAVRDFPNRAHAIPKVQWPKLDNQECIAQGAPQYPPEGSWERRFPYAILMGTMKSGTSALSSYIYQHPNVVSPNMKEVHFFDFSYDEKVASPDGIHRSAARQRYQKVLETHIGTQAVRRIQHTPDLLAIDDSPRYQFWSDRIPARILCVAPWAKILTVLRNPVDRAYSHYNMMAKGRRAKRVAANLPTFEEWVEMDMKLLKRTGVIQDMIDPAEFAGSTEEMNAWKKYTRSGTHGPLGRGLYALQLRHWFKAYEAFGKTRSDFLIVQSEQMRTDKEGVNADVLRFLGLEHVELKREDERNSRSYDAPMANETRDLLHEFFAPYNRELYDLLGWEWEGVWDDDQ